MNGILRKTKLIRRNIKNLILLYVLYLQEKQLLQKRDIIAKHRRRGHEGRETAADKLELIHPAKRVTGAFRRILCNFMALFFLEGKRAPYFTSPPDPSPHDFCRRPVPHPCRSAPQPARRSADAGIPIQSPDHFFLPL